MRPLDGYAEGSRLEGSMKQNERLLVYAVTGFLALILVVAVVFGDAPRAVTGEQPATSNSLGDLLGGGAPADASLDQGPASVATGSGATGGGAT
ncbi:MAG: hypothetical protein ACON4Z_15125, partial [Planctomycetota bacterium]